MVWTATLAGLVVAALLAGLVPELVARIPEPVPEPVREGDGGDPAERPEPKETYAEVAALPRLRVGSMATGAVVGSLVGGALGWDWSLLVWLFLVPVGIALGVVDWRTRLLPTKLIAPSYAVVGLLVLLGGALSGAWHDVLRAAEGWLAFGGLYFVLWFIHPRGLGYGDVRLAGLLGIALGYLGWGEVIVGAWTGFLLGGFGGLLLAAVGVVDRRANPFGPWMLVGAVVGVLLGPALGDHLAATYG